MSTNDDNIFHFFEEEGIAADVFDAYITPQTCRTCRKPLSAGEIMRPIGIQGRIHEINGQLASPLEIQCIADCVYCSEECWKTHGEQMVVDGLLIRGSDRKNPHVLRRLPDNDTIAFGSDQKLANALAAWRPAQDFADVEYGANLVLEFFTQQTGFRRGKAQKIAVDYNRLAEPLLFDTSGTGDLKPPSSGLGGVRVIYRDYQLDDRSKVFLSTLLSGGRTRSPRLFRLSGVPGSDPDTANRWSATFRMLSEPGFGADGSQGGHTYYAAWTKGGQRKTSRFSRSRRTFDPEIRHLVVMLFSSGAPANSQLTNVLIAQHAL